jgi:hypothetical protein
MITVGFGSSRHRVPPSSRRSAATTTPGRSLLCLTGSARSSGAGDHQSPEPLARGAGHLHSRDLVEQAHRAAQRPGEGAAGRASGQVGAQPLVVPPPERPIQVVADRLAASAFATRVAAGRVARDMPTR